MENNRIFFTLFIALFASLISLNTIAADTIMAIPKAGKEGTKLKMSMQDLPPVLQRFRPRIVGGSTAGRNQFPEFAVMYIDGEALGLDPNFIFPACGGTLISGNKVLTAAHCTRGVPARFLFMVPNFYSFNEVTFDDVFLVASKAEHPNFNVNSFDSDAAVLTLNGSSNTPLGSVYGGEEDLTGETATIIGIGATVEGGNSLPDVLRRVEVPVVSNQICKNSYGQSAITSKMICAGLAQGGRDSCQGDSGGPLLVDVRGQRAQAGIVSFGRGCARPTFYGVYSRVSELLGFILQQAPSASVVTGNQTNITPILPLLLEEE